MRYTLLAISLILLTISAGAMHMSIPEVFTPGQILASTGDSPPSNAIGDIEYNAANGDIWISTGNGIAVSRDNGATWEAKLGGIGFAALTVLGDWVCAAASYDFPDPSDPNNDLPAGDGFYISFDGGETFSHCTTATQSTGVGKLAYDVAIFADGPDTVIYAACFYGGLIYSSDRGASWQNAFPDGSDSLTYSDLGHRFFSVAVDTSADPPVVWAGSARGLFKGREGRFAWEKIDTTGHWIPDSIPIYDTLTTDSGIVVDSSSNYYIVWLRDSLDVGALSGNWIISIDFLYGRSTGVFACTRFTSSNSSGSDFDAISYSFDGGTVWKQTGLGYVAWNMGFTGDTLWTACRHGLSRSFAPDYETADTVFISGIDLNSGNLVEVLKEEVVSVTECGSALYVGTYSEGLARTTDRGITWEVIANFPSPEEAASQDPNAKNGDGDYVYAFPNPYSPRYHEGCFFVFNTEAGENIDISLFDYNINHITTIYTGTVAQPGKSRIQWNGLLQNGKMPDNGLYYFKIESGEETFWGKLMIIK